MELNNPSTAQAPSFVALVDLVLVPQRWSKDSHWSVGLGFHFLLDKMETGVFWQKYFTVPANGKIAARYAVCSYVTNKGGTCPLNNGAGHDFLRPTPNFHLFVNFFQIQEISKKWTWRRAWFPDIQEKILSTGHVALVQIECLLERGGMFLEFSSALEFCKRVLAWIRVLVLYSKPVSTQRLTPDRDQSRTTFSLFFTMRTDIPLPLTREYAYSLPQPLDFAST